MNMDTTLDGDYAHSLGVDKIPLFGDTSSLNYKDPIYLLPLFHRFRRLDFNVSGVSQ